MSIGLLEPFYDGERDVLKRFEQTLGCGAIGCALRIAGRKASEFGPCYRPLIHSNSVNTRKAIDNKRMSPVA
jgi:hypothetical protein